MAMVPLTVAAACRQGKLAPAAQLAPDFFTRYYEALSHNGLWKLRATRVQDGPHYDTKLDSESAKPTHILISVGPEGALYGTARGRSFYASGNLQDILSRLRKPNLDNMLIFACQQADRKLLEALLIEFVRRDQPWPMESQCAALLPTVAPIAASLIRGQAPFAAHCEYNPDEHLLVLSLRNQLDANLQIATPMQGAVKLFDAPGREIWPAIQTTSAMSPVQRNIIRHGSSDYLLQPLAPSASVRYLISCDIGGDPPPHIFDLLWFPVGSAIASVMSSNNLAVRIKGSVVVR